MNFLKNRLTITLALCTFWALNAQAKNVPYTQDAYFAQAPQELLDAAAKAAALTQFEANYEVRIPKKAALETTAFYAFTAKNVNPQTNDPVIIINPSWFSALPQDQQDFLLARYFVTFNMGVTPLSTTVLFVLYGLLSLLLFGLFFLALQKTRLKAQKTWVKLLIALGMVIVAELTVLDRLHKRLEHHFSMQHEIAIIQKTIEYSGNKEAAIRALESLDSSIKAAAKNGETEWAPYEQVFGQLADKVKNKANAN